MRRRTTSKTRRNASPDGGEGQERWSVGEEFHHLRRRFRVSLLLLSRPRKGMEGKEHSFRERSNPSAPRMTPTQQPTSSASDAMPCSLSFSAKRPTIAGSYWMTCDESDNVPELVNVFWKYGKLMAEIDCGTFAVADVCGGLTDVKWAKSLSKFTEKFTTQEPT